MNDDKAHVKLRVGDFEVEYEGAASFLKSDLMELVREIASLHGERTGPSSVDQSGIRPSAPKPEPTVNMSMSTVATRLNAKSGPELALAAAAFLTICEGRDVFSRKDILTSMKAAPAYYKKTMSGNLTGSLQSLVKQQRLNETAEDQYALTVAEKQQLDDSLTDDS